ncbi:TPA: hypothetical protein N0F65_005815, partial [Lagenidium giganteum]
DVMDARNNSVGIITTATTTTDVAPASTRTSRDKDKDAPTPPEPQQVVPDPRVATIMLRDRSRYCGHVDESEHCCFWVPEGCGVLSSMYGLSYAGEMNQGKRHGHGVERHQNGAVYFGSFQQDSREGYGLYVSPFGLRYIGAWANGTQHGLGMLLKPDGSQVVGHFTDNELDADVDVAWDTARNTIALALAAQREATYQQENARDAELSAFAEEVTMIASKSFATTEELVEFELTEQQELEQFISDKKELIKAIEAETNELMHTETLLKQRQKQLRSEIQKESTELSLLAKYCDLAPQRRTQLADAEHTLTLLQRQLQALEAHVTMEDTEVEKRERLAVLSLNIFARPEGIHSGKWFGQGDYKDLRTSLLLRKMRDFDVVILQEMFEVGWRQPRFLREAREQGFLYHCGSVWPSLTDRFLIDGGLLILSRYPIVERDQHTFSVGSGSDGMCSKGALYARIQLSPDLSDSVHVFTTHTQAGDNQPEYDIRSKQLTELVAFIKRTIRDDPSAPVLVTGDFNMDARHNLTHKADTGKASSSACVESHVYKQFVDNLQSVLPSGRVVVDLMKKHCTTKLPGNAHPITNGDGHSSLVHKSDPMSPDKDGKCIDYIFFSPATRASEDNSPGVQIDVVETRTHVDHCIVAPLIHDAESVPITHLSDHYGLRAEFALSVSPVTKPDGSLSRPDDKLCDVLQLHFPPQAFAHHVRYFWRWKLWTALLAIVAVSGGAVGTVAQVVLGLF